MTKLNNPNTHEIDYMSLYKQFKLIKVNYRLEDIASKNIVFADEFQHSRLPARCTIVGNKLTIGI